MNRFDLEYQIMDCWGVCDDIQSILDAMDIRELTEDELANILIGLKQLYQLKFETTFNTYEYMIHDGKIL
jgi:hypothetical protein